ncbi:LytR C-terminal domain-containing protein [Agromyces sp. MMS24-JH15]|uniref:LytR C-terminal domain-containing protein n=1 Tax=Agromyces sp. MMS24-JH15 TaxID=3243765 RepID=UPI003749E7A6
MAQKFPRDRFDSVPHGIERIGSHRAPARRGGGWIWFGVAALVTALVVGAGIAWIGVINGEAEKATEQTAAPEPVVTAEPTVAPDVPVTILNATTVPGLAARAQEQLVAAGIPVSTVANASENDLEETYVYYTAPELEGAARGVAAALPEAEIRLDEKFAQFETPIVVVVASDYAAATGG